MAGLLDTSLHGWLDALRSGDSGLAGGSTAALVTAMAAVLAGMAARRGAEEWEEAPGAAAQAETLCARAVELVEEDARAHSQARAALDDPESLPEESRNETLGDALSQAADVPARIADLAADVAVLAAEVATKGHPDSRADATTAAQMAAGAASAATHLVEVNLATGEGDPVLGVAAKAQARAEDAAKRALAATRG